MPEHTDEFAPPGLLFGITRSGSIVHLHHDNNDGKSLCGRRLYEFRWPKNYERWGLCGNCRLISETMLSGSDADG